MSARFSEVCRDLYLELNAIERRVEIDSINDKRTLKELALTCTRELYLGVFFDGTNNNKYRDQPTSSSTNIARLFEAFIGTPSTEKPTYAGAASQALRSAKISPEDFSFYRKIYVPGAGTACPEAHDSGENEYRWLPNALAGSKTRGLAFAALGEARIAWALLQVLNQVHYMFYGQDFPLLANRFSALEKWGRLDVIPDVALQDELPYLNNALAKALAERIKNKPSPRVLHLSVFGFSRGAAEARAFVNMLLRACNGQIGGIRLKIDMMGLFETVASVGVAHITSYSDGHMAWASGENMVIPAEVGRCVHLVSAHEVRMCFPLDSLGQNGSLPSNCKEIVYPGVHSDVGGGYGLNDQGRCATDDSKISQISLAQMYREARMAGVPLSSKEDMPGNVITQFDISPTLMTDFNAYVNKTRIGNVDPAKNVGLLRTMYPSETQPVERLEDIVHRHYGHFIAWRKYRINNIHKAPRLKNSPPQDTYDIWQTNEKLKEESSDAYLKYLLGTLVGGERIINESIKQTSPILGLLLGDTQILHAMNDAKEGFIATRKIFDKANLNSEQDSALILMFGRYVHDSRAWFKLGGEPDDEWFGSGVDAKGKKRESKKEAYRKNLSKLREFHVMMVNDLSNHPTVRASSAKEVTRIDAEIALYEKWGDTLQAKGESTQESISWGAGYLRWRTIYSTSDSRRNAPNLREYDVCVLNYEVD